MIDDNITEPYEFFTFTILSVTEVGSFKKPVIKNLKRIIYIEDDDCKFYSFNLSYLLIDYFYLFQI